MISGLMEDPRKLGQICMRMNENSSGVFFIGLPEDEYYNDKIEKLETALKKLDVKVLVVGENKTVTIYAGKNG